MPGLLKERSLRQIYLVTILAITGYFCAMSYQDAFLAKVARLDETAITGLFFIQGTASVAGGLLFPFCAARFRHLLPLTVLGMGLPLLLLPSAPPSPLLLALPYPPLSPAPTALAAFNVDCQSEVVKSTRGNASTVAMAIFSGLFNLGIAMGTLAGAGICSSLNLAGTAIAGGLLLLAALPLFLVKGTPPRP